GFCGAFIIMHTFYELQNEDKILPEITVNFHPMILFCLVIVPTAFFAVLAVCYAYFKLKKPVLMLLKNNFETQFKKIKHKGSKNTDCSFVDDLKKDTLKSKKTLVFFIIFASFCFSAMMQMSFSMNELASVLMGLMIMLIGIVLACTTLFLAITTVINGNTKTIAMMRVFGYSHKECCKALLSGYRPMAYIGFAVGTVYQYALLKIMVSVVFKNIGNVPDYSFDKQTFIITLISFVFIYEFIMHCYSKRIKKISIKNIML
ncbi:MAG: FtsX-like permease family protein, partial [Ruminococcus sp.]|nr:FtsX-like permease family protein [Ruminococcus sp.]